MHCLNQALATFIFFLALLNGGASAERVQTSETRYRLSKQEYAALKKMFPDLKLADCNRVENKKSCFDAQLRLAFEAWKFRYLLVEFPFKARIEKSDLFRFSALVDKRFKSGPHEANRARFWSKDYLELDACLGGQCAQGLDANTNFNELRGAWRGANEFLNCLNSTLPREHGNVELSQIRHTVNQAIVRVDGYLCAPARKDSALLIARVLKNLRW